MEIFFKKIKTMYWRIVSIGARYYFGNPSVKLKIVGVTGTNGKTTTATLLYKIATSLGYKAGLVSTVENIIVGEKRLTNMTTPDSISLTKLFAEMVEKGCEYVFMEVSSHALDQGRVAGINFIGGIFTNLTHDHLDYHKNLENYFLAKKKFFQMLPATSFALSNTDDEHGVKMLEGIKARKFLYRFNQIPKDGLQGSLKTVFLESFFGEIKKLNLDGLELKFNQIEIKSKLLGKFNAYNLLAVWSTCSLLNFDIEKVNKILETIEPPRGRFEHFMSKSGVMVIVDYAHTPDALQNVLSMAGQIKSKEGRLIAVFGCGGDRDPFKRSKMGRIGVALSDIPIFTSDNPRSEDPNKIIYDMMGELYPEDLKKLKNIPNRHEAILEAVKIAKSGDIILVAGKGHEDYQEIKDVKHHFNDMKELKKAFT
ncbi:UDP-N-acetylmuramoyl-L-alanyl-D-glutamate--2,6-diaminopimelate ligase [Candidatus Nomurabacteria bacterium]|nr:UDP-N-acetylmuramoyl-L-alanyl-D-glutamate--2,6-diaminopimelate ligase [Candidatus Nomurabacteria bacterium]